MTQTESPLDIADPNHYDAGIPHHLFSQMRSTPGLTWNADGPHGAGFWSVTRLADVVTVSRDTTTFSSELGHIQIYDIDEDVRDKRASMIDLDPPVHTRLRRLVSTEFTPRHVQSYTKAARARVRRALEQLVTDGGGDWVKTVAAPIPIGVICDILGVPESDHQLMIEMSDHLVEGTSGEPLDPTAYGNITPLRELPFNSPAASGIYDYAVATRNRLLAAPADNLLSRLAHAEIDGDRLSETEYARFFQLMIFAGNETTRSAMAHLAINLMEFPEQFRTLGSERESIDLAVEEIVRYSSPILYFRRTATADTELSGTSIRAGEKVVMWYASANFDEGVFDNPLRFDITRPKVPNNVAFGGGGAHFCLGASLARLEISVLLEEVMAMGLTLEANGPATFVQSNFVNAVEHLPVLVAR